MAERTPPVVLHEVQQPGRRIDRVLRASSVEEALRFLRSTPGALPIAGGTDLLLDLQRGGPGPDVTLVDLSAVGGFRSIVDDERHLLLGGGVTHNQVVGDPVFAEQSLPLAQACLEIGSPQLRNRATIAGNLATASPANDTISALMALGADVELTSMNSTYQLLTRRVAVEDFFTGFRQTALADGELITEIRVPKLRSDQRAIWVKLGNRRAQAISVIHAAIVLTLDGDGVGSSSGVVITDARLAIGSVAATVVLVPEFAAAVIGTPLGDTDAHHAAAQAVADAITPIDDIRATAVYRTDAVVPLIERSLGALASGAHGSMWPADPPLLSTLVGPGLRTVSTSRLDDETPVSITVNGDPTTAGHGGHSLLDWLRARGYDGVKEGCAEGECGACTVHLDGDAVMSCLVDPAQADGGQVATIEGLGDGDVLHALQQAFIDEFAVQCGFCIPGFLMAGARLLEEHPDPTDDQIRLALSGNLCRCTGYYTIIEAVRTAAHALAATTGPGIDR